MRLIIIKENDKYCLANGIETYLDRSYVSGNEIYLDIYRNKEWMIASFFHEIGHIYKIDKIINSEEMAWKIGFKLSKKFGFSFSTNTYNWANEQLKTYEK